MLHADSDAVSAEASASRAAGNDLVRKTIPNPCVFHTLYSSGFGQF
jgi:hypothetical protein